MIADGGKSADTYQHGNFSEIIVFLKNDTMRSWFENLLRKKAIYETQDSGERIKNWIQGVHGLQLISVSEEEGVKDSE